jgi:GH25 family lysozyme M1 (1,4-beta-N-acetylmuramidase)
MLTFGVDVSHWEGAIDWSVASQWIPFAYYKCTDGETKTDITFMANKMGCTNAGIPHAPYHYFQPTLDPIKQADHFIKVAGDGYHRYIVDIEEKQGVSTPWNPNHLHDFLQRVEELTLIKPAIYTSAGFWNEFVNPKPSWAHQYDLIVAHYSLKHQPLLPIGWDKWTIWQFTDCFYFPGCKEKSDADWFNGNLDQCRAWFGNFSPVDRPVFNKTRLRSQFNHLHIRRSPTTYAEEVGLLGKGEIVELDDISGTDVWIKHNRGWSCVEQNDYRYMEVVK